MPDLTAGNRLATMDDELASALTGQIFPEVNPPAADVPNAPQGAIAVISEDVRLGDPNFSEGVHVEVGHSPDSRTAPPRYAGEHPVPHDTAGGDAPRGQESFDVDNDESTPVFQRATEAWTGAQFTITGPTQIARRMKGRTQVTVFCPNTDVNGNSILGVTIAPDPSEVQNAAGAIVGSPLFLLPGMSITIPTEAPVWAGLIGTNATGFVCVMTTDNPSGGQLGGL